MQCHQVFAPLTLVQVHSILNVQPLLQLPYLLLSINSLDNFILFDLVLDRSANWGLALLRDLSIFSVLIKENLL